MSFTLPGIPSDQLPAVLATGRTDVDTIFVSMAAREPDGRDADYLAWHSLDHRPEQYRIDGIRHSLRLVSTPACRALRVCSEGRFDAVDHVMTYFFTANAAFEQFNHLSAALGGERRPFRLPTVEAGYLRLAGMVASPHAIAGADVVPWRPARGVYLLVEEILPVEDSSGALSPAALVELPGVAGIWWHRGGVPPLPAFRDNSGLLLTYCFLDEDPLQVAGQMPDPLHRRWASGAVRPLLAAPFRLPMPFEWDRHLP